MNNKQYEGVSMVDVRELLAALDELRQENIAFKNRLSEAVRQSTSRPFIEEAEHFQQRSIDKDQVIDLLRYDIANLLVKLRYNGLVNSHAPVLLQQVAVLWSDVQKLASGFEQMRRAFDLHLSTSGPK